MTGSYQRPADYYSQPPAPGTEKKGCPKWVPIGCGAAGCLVLVLLAVGGMMIVRGGGGKMLNWAFGQIQKDLGTFYAADVTPDQRAALEGELTTLRANITAGKVQLVRLQPVLQDMQSAVSDRSLTSAEVQDLTKAMQEVNSTPAR